MSYYPMLRSPHLIPRHQSHKLYLLLMELLVKYPRTLLNVLPNRSRSWILFLSVLPRMLIALVKPQRSMLSSLPQKIRRKENARVKLMPQNRVLPNCLLVNIHNRNLSIPASFVRKITTLRIVLDDLKLFILSMGPLLSSKIHFCLSRPKW